MLQLSTLPSVITRSDTQHREAYVASVPVAFGTPNSPYMVSHHRPPTDFLELAANERSNNSIQRSNKLLCFDGNARFSGHDPFRLPGEFHQVFFNRHFHGGFITLAAGQRMEQYLVASAKTRIELSILY